MFVGRSQTSDHSAEGSSLCSWGACLCKATVLHTNQPLNPQAVMWWCYIILHLPTLQGLWCDLKSTKVDSFPAAHGPDGVNKQYWVIWLLICICLKAWIKIKLSIHSHWWVLGLCWGWLESAHFAICMHYFPACRHLLPSDVNETLSSTNRN